MNVITMFNLMESNIIWFIVVRLEKKDAKKENDWLTYYEKEFI